MSVRGPSDSVSGNDGGERYGTLWTRDELILAFDLYCRIPFRSARSDNPEVIRLGHLLNRSPASVARKLGNFGSFDPALRERNIVGLTHAGKLDREVWDEFHDDWNRLVLEAARLSERIGLEYEQEPGAETDVVFPGGASEKEATRKIRIHQAFFRDAVLSSYEDTCCVTGLKIRKCLVASHIKPWGMFEENRADPRNGLCLSATFDRLFDTGLITVTPELKVVVSASLLGSEDRRTQEMVCKFHGAPIRHPWRFPPLESYLEWHGSTIFHD